MQNSQVMKFENICTKCGALCMGLILGSLLLGFIACFAGFVYLIFCLCG